MPSLRYIPFPFFPPNLDMSEAGDFPPLRDPLTSPNKDGLLTTLSNGNGTLGRGVIPGAAMMNGGPTSQANQTPYRAPPPYVPSWRPPFHLFAFLVIWRWRHGLIFFLFFRFLFLHHSPTFSPFLFSFSLFSTLLLFAPSFLNQTNFSSTLFLDILPRSWFSLSILPFFPSDPPLFLFFFPSRPRDRVLFHRQCARIASVVTLSREILMYLRVAFLSRISIENNLLKRGLSSRGFYPLYSRSPAREWMRPEVALSTPFSRVWRRLRPLGITCMQPLSSLQRNLNLHFIVVPLFYLSPCTVS